MHETRKRITGSSQVLSIPCGALQLFFNDAVSQAGGFFLLSQSIENKQCIACVCTASSPNWSIKTTADYFDNPMIP